MRSRIKVAILAVAAAAVIPWGTGQAVAAPDQGNVLGKKSEWQSPGNEARDLLEQTIGDDLPQFPYCRRPLERLDLMINSSDFVWPNSLTILGETQTVDINNLDLIGGPFADPSRKLWWSSGMWLAWRAAVFAENGQPKLAEQAARALLNAVASNPDPGVPTPESREAAAAVSWAFGPTYRRSQALLCLRAVLPAAELEPYIRMHANTFLEPLRYPGPPRTKPHNLGMLVNLHLLDVADAIGDPNYAAAAAGRLSSEFPQVFSKAGFSYEGSSHYHGVNYLGWTEAMFALQNRGYTAEAAALAEILKRALDAAAHFISPTGDPLLLGNTRASDALIRPDVVKGRELTLVDKEAGLAFGRSSWTKKSATAWSAVNRPTRRGSHGHYDALAVSWQTDGVPILVDVGQPRYDRSPLTEWSRSTAAHNTVNVVGQNTMRYAKGSLKHRKDSRIDVVNMRYANKNFNCQREAMWDDRRKLFSAHDSCNGRASQNWMFHPDWKVDRIKKNQAQLSHPSGKKLYVTATKGAKISACGGSESPICGWYATDFDVVVPTPQLVIAGGKAIDTQFTFGAPPIPAAAKMIGRPKEMNRKVSTGWKPIQVKATKKAAKKSKKNKKAAKLGNPVGYQTQIQRKNGNWTTVDISSSPRKLSTAANNLENGVPVRTRVRVWYKNGLSLPSKPTGWVTPHTTPGRVGIAEAKLIGKGKKPKVQLKCSSEDDGGAKVSAFEFKVGKSDWQRTKRCGAKFVMPGKKTVISWRAFNRAGAGKIVTWKLTIDSQGQLYVNGAPYPPPATPAPPETAPPA